jgi:hypothetical protein
MRCPLCMYDNPPDYQFCGSCGQKRGSDPSYSPPDQYGQPHYTQPPYGQPQYAQPSPPAPVATVQPTTAPPAPPASTPSVFTPLARVPAQAPPADAGPGGRSRPAGDEMTRYLCAAVTINKDLATTLIENILEEQHRAVAVTPGLDLVAVLKYALAANRRRMTRDVLLFLTLCLLGLSIASVIGILLVVPLLFIAWLIVFIEHYASFYGRAAKGLRPGNFDPTIAHAPAHGSFTANQLDRIAAAAREGNVILYSAFPPFLGYGRVRSSWSVAIDVTKPRRGAVPQPFTAQEIYDHIKLEVARLDLPRLEMTDRVVVSGHDIENDMRFLPDPQGMPATSVSDDTVRQLIAVPEEHARPYLAISMTGWHGDIVVTTFLRVVLTQTDLFVETAHTVVPPIREAFKAIDELGLTPTGSEFFSVVGLTIVGTVPRLLGSIPSLLHALGADGRREKKRRRVYQTSDYGALLSVREAAADTRWQRYFQIVDDTRYARVVELRILRSLTEFLKAHDVDTSSLEAQTETVINNGVSISGNATVVAGQIAGGPEAQAAGIISRLRGSGEGARSTEGGGGS